MQNLDKPTNNAILHSLFWLTLVPQCLLLLLNFRSWHLISGEAGENEIYAALVLLVCEILVITGALIIYWLYRQGKMKINALTGLIGLIAQAGYMILFLSTVGDVIPNTVQPWIVSEGNVGRWNITLMMPGAFISLYAFTKATFSEMAKTKGRWLTFGLTLGVPLVWYLFSTLMQPTWFGQFSIVGWIIIASAFVTLFLAAIINVFDNLLHKEFSTHMVEKHYIAALLLGLAAPLGGLYLNRSIPFPTDFQTTNVYVLTVLNGLILLLKPGNTRYLAGKYFLRCLSFPFILYFFLVFLPFLPLSLLAVIAFGAGFLMLTPLVLGLFQFRATQFEFNLVVSQQGKTKAVMITVFGLLILPTYFVAQATLDKAAINKTLDYFYAHDYEGSPLSDSDIKRAAKTLVQLRDRKLDVQMPYISEFYNAIVFGDLVLPDTKIAQTYRLLTNETLPEFKADVLAREGRSRRFRGNFVKPNTEVAVENIEQLPTQSPLTKTLRLTLRNQSEDTHTLYRETLEIPEGVFVTGLRLKIESEWVNGRLFDKKTALWVFQKITEFRRDPAIIYYTSPTTLELRVYPFPANGIREVELDIAYHPELDASIGIGTVHLDLNPEDNKKSVISSSGNIAFETAPFAWVRTPYLHVILDFSAGAKHSTTTYINELTAAGKKLGIDKVKLTAANISSAETNSDELIELSNQEELAQAIDKIRLSERGGFWLEQAIANEILRINSGLRESNLTLLPIFFVALGNEIPLDVDYNVHKWNRLIPDGEQLYINSNGILTAYSLATGLPLDTLDIAPPKPIVAFKQNDKIHIFPANRSSIAEFDPTDSLAIYNPETNQFETIETEKKTNPLTNNWANLARTWDKWAAASLQPSTFEDKRQAFLEAGRENSLLLPSTAFIVVEADSQWKILERKEDQSLKNHSALEFEEERQASEPSWWILLAFVLLYIYIKDKKVFSRKF